MKKISYLLYIFIITILIGTIAAIYNINCIENDTILYIAMIMLSALTDLLFIFAIINLIKKD